MENPNCQVRHQNLPPVIFAGIDISRAVWNILRAKQTLIRLIKHPLGVVSPKGHARGSVIGPVLIGPVLIRPVLTRQPVHGPDRR